MPLVDGADIRFAHVSLEPATVRGIINRIVQDDKGFIWLGTNHGLLRYDGYQFRPFIPNPEDPNSIRGTNVLALLKDRSGHLWVGSDQHVDRYDPVSGVFQPVLPDAANTCGPAGIVRDIAQDRHGLIWVSTDNGLLRHDPSTSNTTCYQHRQEDESSLSSGPIMTTLDSRDGNFWVATSLGLDQLDRSTGRVTRHVILRGPSGVPLRLEGNKVTLFEDHAGVFWITIPAGQETGLASFDPRSGVQSAYLFGPGPAETAFSILEDGDQTLWFGLWQQGIVRFDRERKRAVRYSNHPGNRASLSPGAVVSLLQDRERRIWAGFDPPVVDFFDPRPPPFEILRHDPGDPDNLNNAVVSVLEDSRGVLWVGRLFGLDRVDRTTGHVTRYVGKSVSGRLVFRTVHAIAEDRAGNLWFGEWGNGLDRFDPRTGGYRFYNHDPTNPTSLSSDIVESLYLDRRGTLWVGTYNALDRFDPTTEQFRAYRSPVPGSSQYRAITEDPSGALWLASLGNGLHRFDPATGQFTVYRKNANDRKSLSSNIVNTVHVDRSGTVWAGTSDGLCGLDQDAQTFTCYHSGDGLASSVVEGILEDERGDLWLSTSDGLSRFNPRTKTFRNYYAEDGLPADEFRFGAASRSSTGEMFFGSTSGLLAFFPERVIDDPSPPPVVLTDFWLFGNRVRAGQNPLRTSASYLESLTLGPQQNIFSFEFSALNYSNPRRNRYQYRLEGLEEQWNERDSSQRLVTYTTLPPGEYVFRVKASNSLGVSNESGTSVRIRILPPWWSTWWFRLVSLVVGLALLGGLYQWRIQQLRQQERALREALDTIPAIAWMTWPDGSPEFVNRRWVEYTGLSAAETASQGWHLVVDPDDFDRSVAKWRASLATGEPFDDEARCRRAGDGEYRWFLTRAVPLRDRRGKIIRWYGVMTDIEDRKDAERTLQELAGELIDAQEHERSRIGRELHDDISQTLALLSIKIDQLRDEPEMPRTIATALAQIRQDTANVTEDVHRLSHRLHSSTLDHLGLVRALQRGVADFSNRTSISVAFTHESLSAAVPSDLALCLFRIAQESLNNIIKHSQARSAQVRLIGTTDGIHLMIEDDGVGFDSADLETLTGLGFVSMRERLRLVHGTLRIDSAPGQGTRIEALVPTTSPVAEASRNA